MKRHAIPMTFFLQVFIVMVEPPVDRRQERPHP